MNVKCTFLALAALAAMTVFAEKAKDATADAAKAQREAARAEKRLQRMKADGGKIILPGTMKGTLLFVNAQKRVPDFGSDKIMRMFSHFGHYNTKIVEGASVTPQTAEAARKKAGAEVAVFVVDDPALGMMLAAPEEGWAIVNVAKLVTDNPKPPYAAARTRKEIIRAVATLAHGSTYDAPIVSQIAKLTDFDEIVNERLPIDVTVRLNHYLGGRGVTPYECSTYRDALTDGFDIAPTNDFQKAIYDELKKGTKAAK